MPLPITMASYFDSSLAGVVERGILIFVSTVVFDGRGEVNAEARCTSTVMRTNSVAADEYLSSLPPLLMVHMACIVDIGVGLKIP